MFFVYFVVKIRIDNLASCLRTHAKPGGFGTRTLTVVKRKKDIQSKALGCADVQKIKRAHTYRGCMRRAQTLRLLQHSRPVERSFDKIAGHEIGSNLVKCRLGKARAGMLSKLCQPNRVPQLAMLPWGERQRLPMSAQIGAGRNRVCVAKHEREEKRRVGVCRHVPRIGRGPPG